MNTAGHLIGKIGTEEASFASTGLSRQGSLKPHKFCINCVQTFCPIWQLVHGSGSKTFA